MILELLKLKSLVATRLIERGEATMVKRYRRKEAVENQIKTVQSVESRPLTLEDLQSLMDSNTGATLQIDGREVTITPASAAKTAAVGRTTLPGLSLAGTTVTEVASADESLETEAALAETILETIVVPEPSEELRDEIASSFGEITFTVAEVDEIIANIGKPTTVITTPVEELPQYNSTMTLGKLSICRPDEDEPILTGNFISSSIFSGCEDPECDACAPGGEDEDGAIILHYVSDEGPDRTVNTIELEPGLIATISL
jgi:hypothetical protein